MLYSHSMAGSIRSSLQAHARFIRSIRGYFGDHGYAEVDTPSLCPYLIPEPAIEVFRTEYLSSRGAAVPLWLAPSPELWMKRLLARGSGSIFQISHSYRNGDLGGPVHNPEFRLLEWYTAGSGTSTPSEWRKICSPACLRRIRRDGGASSLRRRFSACRWRRPSVDLPVSSLPRIRMRKA